MEWTGYYLDGVTAVRQSAVIRLKANALEIRTDVGNVRWWPYEEIRLTQGSRKDHNVRLLRGEPIQETLVVPDQTFLFELNRVAPKSTTRFSVADQLTMRLQLLLLAAIAAVAFTAALYLWGLPAAARTVASIVPIQWEQALGQSIIDDLDLSADRCLDPVRENIIDDILASLVKARPGPGYTFQVWVLDDDDVNAFALPGGHILIYRGLLERSETAEELAAVLAHEVQHILKRHGTRALLQDLSSGLLLTALTGDTGGPGAFLLESGRTLSLLRYSREQEQEADQGAIQMLLEAKVALGGMVAILQRLEEDAGAEGRFLTYISTHPAPLDRINRLNELSTPTHRSSKLLPDYEWRDMGNICQT